mmetsp:Transcript_909/g.1382  ORF Transcript_909/g.1382 Transcript_909/m.1382 type:complete len:273 (+) Transcript_909:257-1075(+)
MIIPVIPGLTFEHFACGNDEIGSHNGSPRSVVTRIPRLKAAQISKGTFCFEWDARDYSSTYNLYAKGNILKRQSVVGLRKWWGFKCHCTCASFAAAEHLTLKVGETENYVCEHLHAALLSVIDTEGFVIDAPRRLIPGLTTHHFVNGNCLKGGLIQYNPVLKRADVDRHGYFHFVWEAIGGVDVEKSFELGAHGDIIATTSSESDNNNNSDNNDWGFETYCTCPDFVEQYCRRVSENQGANRQNYVCKHLAAALENSIDRNAQIEFELSNKL